MFTIRPESPVGPDSPGGLLDAAAYRSSLGE